MFPVRSTHFAPALAASLPASPLALWRIVYGLYAWLQFLLMSLLALAGLLTIGPLARRRGLIRRAARLALALAGMRLKVQGLSSLPASCVIVANHCSYLDGVVLAALLPARFSFVIKREMSAVPLAGLLLRRIGVEFVERRARRQVLRDTRRLLRQAQLGESLVFFPEGTFSREVGLLHFHIGAFAAAARANLPVVPVAIQGTRHRLPPGSPWPAPGRIEVRVLAQIPPRSAQLASTEAQGERARQLRESARGALLAALGEPDLAATG
ncbi:MAG TPA: lysophospholipid acyltransferase family protein [Steroidobacteraceae bacterium]|jgi:1-acyl-sn-glycerol-3-phosphate acyltransferase|nr:lysophospholipid acyltransferase family protein [Steroidobacteraceae bacterium]